MNREYTRFSFAVHVTPLQKEWLLAANGIILKSSSAGGSNTLYVKSAVLTYDDLKWLTLQFREEDIFRDNEQTLYEAAGIRITEGRHFVYIYAEQDGQPYVAAIICQRFLKHFDLNDITCFSWATFGDEPSIATFGGGVCAVHKDEIMRVDTNELLSELASDMRRRHPDASLSNRVDG
jgi:hypothetical protein